VDSFLDAPAEETRERGRARLGLVPDDFVIGTVARLAELKGPDDLLMALAEEMKKNPKWKLLWGGGGGGRGRVLGRRGARGVGLAVVEVDRESKGVGADLAAEDGGGPEGVGARSVARETARGQVIVTGLVDPGRIPGLMRAMDVLAHPSYREGLPRTVP